jgi:hypothetical protein
MKKNILFVSIGVLLSAFLLFLLRLSSGTFFTKPLNILIVMGALALVIGIIGVVKKMNKPMLMSAGGIVIIALLTAGLMVVGLKDNVTSLVIFLVLGFVLLLYGVIKGK